MIVKRALLFPGQGSQYVGMGKDLFVKYPLAKETFQEANDTMNVDLTKLMFEGSLNELTRTEYAQPALLAVGMAMFRVYMEVIGTDLNYMAGHSLGEITALTCSGSIPFASAIRIVHRRGELMREAAAFGGGAMAAVNELDVSEVAAICASVSSTYKGGAEIVVVSNINSEDQIVISGHKGALSKAAERLTERGGVVIPLQVSAPFHSPLMAPAAEQFAEELSKHKFTPLQYPVISSVTAKPYASSDEIAKVLTEQLTAPVQWTAVLRYLRENGVSEAVEMGPKAVLKKLARNTAGIKVLAFDYGPDVEQLLSESKVAKQDNPLDFIIQCIAIATCTRNRNWDSEAYTQGVVTPYRNVQTMLYQLQKSGGQVAWTHMEQAYAMLLSVLKTKLVPEHEQLSRLERLLADNGLQEKFGKGSLIGAMDS
ncbi:ACP S-malonyltransferase [Paenibacillus sp. IHBB 10380]|uniref:ACP S-malonyltransferase n=1 Tax=Paenibacillus sp. IHBB 10380 TaxID=1566358 RepID=UPI0005CFB4B5|nr:ACP S-malonyltransferase [Paenibacillus sp. IHBB 10380]